MFRAAAALSLLILTLGCGPVGSGGLAPPEPASERACPCGALGLGLHNAGPLRAGIGYVVYARPARVSAFPEQGKRTFALDLDRVTAAEATVRDGVPLLFLAGCRGGDPVLLVLSDTDDDGVADEPLGELTLPPDVRVVGLAVLPTTTDLYAVDDLGQKVWRLVDEDGDHVPDQMQLFAAVHSELPPFHGPTAIWSDRTGLLMVQSDMGCCRYGDELIVILHDADADGVAERVEVTIDAYLDEGGPKLTAPPRSTDRTLRVWGCPGATLELWWTDAAGTPAERLALAHIPEDGPWTLGVPLDRALCLGDHVRVLDAERGVWGGIHRVHAPYPRIESIHPRELVRAEGGLLQVTGSGLERGLRLELRQGDLRLPLRTLAVTPTTCSVEIPPLPDAWPHAARLVVTSDASPEGAPRLRLRLLEPPDATSPDK